MVFVLAASQKQGCLKKHWEDSWQEVTTFQGIQCPENKGMQTASSHWTLSAVSAVFLYNLSLWEEMFGLSGGNSEPPVPHEEDYLTAYTWDNATITHQSSYCAHPYQNKSQVFLWFSWRTPHRLLHEHLLRSGPRASPGTCFFSQWQCEEQSGLQRHSSEIFNVWYKLRASRHCNSFSSI